MSSQISDENDDSYNELAHSLVRVSSRRDSGYLTFSSPCTASPSRLSPSSVVLHQLESPIFEREPHSPVNAARQKFASTLDFEHYRSTRKHFDILTQIHHRNAHHLVDTILDKLSPHDLQRCATVCRTWYSILKGHSRRKQAKNIKRDLFHLTNKTPRRKSKPTNTPMQTITNLLDTKPPVPSLVEPTSNDENVLPSTPSQSVLTSSPDKNVHLAASAMSFRYGYLKYLHGPTVPKRCPICAYVSIVDVNDQHGVCTNPLCRNSFCQCCSGPYHPSSPCKTTTGPVRSPWRRRPAVSPIFSNKTRSNLRRLLM